MLKKFFAWFSIFSLILQIGSGVFLYRPVLSEENATPTPEATVTEQPIEPATEPTPEITPSAEPTLEPTPTIEPTPSAEPMPSIEPEATVTPTLTEEVTPTSPVENNQPALENSAPPDETGPPAAAENGHLSAVILQQTKASSIDKMDLDYQTEGSATLKTDKLDYAPTDTVLIAGTGFLAGKTYTLYITSETGPLSFSDSVTADENGNLFYSYQLDGNYRPNYLVELKDSSGQIVASVTFTDAAGVTLTPATGGSSISADTTGGNYTTLTGPVITESVAGQISGGGSTIILNVPAGFSFRTTADSVIAAVTDFGTCTGGNKVIKVGTGPGSNSETITPISTSITVNIKQASAGNCYGSITLTGIAVRPTAGTPLASGNITKTGTSTIVGITDGVTNFGTLTEVAGAFYAAAPISTLDVDKLLAVADNVDQITATITAKDQFGNPLSGLSANLLSTGTGNTFITNPTSTNASGVANIAIKSTKAESGKTLSATVGGIALIQTRVATFTPGPVSTITVSPDTATVESSYTQAFTAISIDAFGNPVSESYTWSVNPGTGTATINSSGVLTAGNPGTVTVTATGATTSDTSSTITIPAIIPPTVTSAKVTSSNQVTIVFNAAVNCVAGDFTNLEILNPATVTGISGSGTNTIVLTYTGGLDWTSATGTVDLGAGIVRSDTGTPLVPVTGQALADGRNPTAYLTYSNGDGVRAGQFQTITAHFSEDMASGTPVKIALAGANTLAATNMTKWTSSEYRYDHFVGAGNGLVTVTLSIGTDNSPAANIITSTPTSGATFIVDNIVPTTSDDIDGNWHKTDQTITLSCDDGTGAGCDTTYYTTDGSTPTTSSSRGTTITFTTDGVYTVRYFSKDKAGNSEAVKTAVNQVKIDKTPPTCDSFTVTEETHPENIYTTGTNIYYGSNLGSDAIFTITSPATDLGSGIQSVVFDTINIGLGGVGGGSDLTFPYASSYNVGVGSNIDSISNPQHVHCYDNAGNTAQVSFNVYIDNAAPTISTVSLNHYNVQSGSTITVTSDGADALTGVAECNAYWSTDTTYDFGADTLLADLGSDCDGDITIPAGDGTFYVVVGGLYGVTDNVNNWDNKNVASSATIVDNTPPTVVITAPVVAQPVNADYAITFTDNELTNAQCSIDNSVWVACISGTTTLNDVTGFGALGQGAFTLYLKDTDAAGNTGTNTVVGIIKDTTAPTGLGTPTANVTTPTNQTLITWTWNAATDLISGVKQYIWRLWQNTTNILNGTTVNTSHQEDISSYGEGDYLFDFQSEDNASNKSGIVTSTTTTVDTTAPVITVPADITAEAASALGAIVTYTAPAATDAQDGSKTVTCDKNSGDTFPMGLTTVNCSSTDTAGNTANKTFKVTVQDTTAPLITAHGDETAEATGPSGAAVSYTSPTTSDNFDAPGTATCSPLSDNTFLLVDTTVTCNAVDSAGNNATPTTFVVHVVDTTPAVLSLPSDMADEATGPSGNVESFTATASDLVDGSVGVTCTPFSGSTFGLGNTTVNCNATDSNGNTATGSFKVTIQDTTTPIIAFHSDETTEATSTAGTTVFYTSPATTDAVDGAGVASCLPASGSTFVIGTTPVTCNAVDVAGNHATPTTFNVTVQDTTPPTITGTPSDISTQATSPAGAAGVIYINPSATDIVDGSVAVTCSPNSGSTFVFGDTTVTCTATDTHSNSSHTSFKVTVADTTIPVIILNGIDSVTIQVHGTYIEEGATVTDNYDTGLSAIITGTVDVDTVGSYVLHYNAADSHSNHAAEVTRTVNVVDTQIPVITLTGANPQIIEVGTSYSDLGATVADNYDTGLTASVDATAVDNVHVGSYTVKYTAVDSSGNHADEVNRTVNVVDTTKPVITLIGSTPVTLEVHSAYTDAGASAFDNYDGDLTSSIVTVNPVDKDVLGTYIVTYNVSDAAGNPATEVTRTVNVVDTTGPEKPTAGPAAGDYTSDQSVTLTSADSGSGLAAIYYTTDSSTPDNTKTLYTAPITVDKDMTIKAIAYDNAGNTSDILTAVYGIAPNISAETSASVASSSVTITWTTDDLSTSRVIYDTVSHSVLGAAPNYGYANSTIEDSTKVISHSVGLTSLTSGTTYYYRTVSHGSPETVSPEKSFSTSSVTTDGGGGGTVLGAATAPVCTDAKPGIPTGFTAVAGPGVGQVILSWTPPNLPYTYFLIAYSDSSSWPPKWGNPDVGNITAYTVSGLGGGTYWFWLRAGNGCMPGDFVGPISPGVIAGVPGAPAVAPEFLPGVLGEEATPSAEVEKIAPTPEVGEVAGAETKKPFPWWILLLLILVVSASGYYWLKRKKS